MKKAPPPASVDAYIAGFPRDVQAKLEQVRETIRKAAPGATEAISYGIACFKLGGKYLIYFAAFKEHIGLYPVHAKDVPEIAKQLAPYASGKASLRFPLAKAMPRSLIAKIVKLKVSSRASAPSRR